MSNQPLATLPPADPASPALLPKGLSIHPAPTPEQAAAIAAAIAAATAQVAVAAPQLPRAWALAARVEGLTLVRRLNTQLDMRLMGAPTRERLTRSAREGR